MERQLIRKTFKNDINIISCKSKGREKEWKIMFDFIFSGDGLINQTYFITKHVGKLVTHLLDEVNSGHYLQGWRRSTRDNLTDKSLISNLTYLIWSKCRLNFALFYHVFLLQQIKSNDDIYKLFYYIIIITQVFWKDCIDLQFNMLDNQCSNGSVV